MADEIIKLLEKALSLGNCNELEIELERADISEEKEIREYFKEDDYRVYKLNTYLHIEEIDSELSCIFDKFGIRFAYIEQAKVKCYIKTIANEWENIAYEVLEIDDYLGTDWIDAFILIPESVFKDDKRREEFISELKAYLVKKF